MQDIGALPSDLNYATSLFFITFVIFQPISAAIGRYVGPKHWIPFLMVCFSTAARPEQFHLLASHGLTIARSGVLGSYHHRTGFHPWSWYVSKVYNAWYTHRLTYLPQIGQMIALRLLIGLFEAGFYPTAVGYLSTFYTRFDLAIRVGIFYGQYAIAGAFSGALCKS